jgi:hypothetical protein
VIHIGERVLPSAISLVEVEPQKVDGVTNMVTSLLRIAG